ncbi:hypothetical protein RIF29_40084 [Crotalaria pallida]|uniref:Uncharacterized protein n=1 Tax=Crotalaria pallida TaxID=3830 RepID=A0AAN9E2H2_CROPI
MDLHSPVNAVYDGSISNLEITCGESLHIEDALETETESAAKRNDISDVANENLYGDLKQQETNPNKKCLTKSATFPVPEKMLPSSSSSDEESAHQTFSRSASLPTPSNIISAMKGSREKHMGIQMKLTVKWAPDVYDPIPTLMSHTVKNKKQQKSKKKRNEKKNGKKGQKGNSSRGGNGKDKKQPRKPGGTSELCYKPPDTPDKVIEASTELNALDVCIQDSYCGTSFLKKSVTGNSSRGGNGKDKKQPRKPGGTSELCYKPPDTPDKVIEASTELNALDVCIQDSYCGTSFLKKSVTELHYPVAEALGV